MISPGWKERSVNGSDLWIFDCDGVILQSNELKTEAFREVAARHDTAAAEQLVEFHRRHGGVSRYRKFRHLFEEILGWSDFDEAYADALARFAEIVSSGMRSCPEVPGVREFLEEIAPTGQVFVASGSDEIELREVLRDRDLARYFVDIFGSPRTKREIVSGILSMPGLPAGRKVFVGDSEIDYRTASEFGFEFLMISGYTEWAGWRGVVPDHSVRIASFEPLIGSGGLLPARSVGSSVS
jgi:phosphoglycolate phosphatase-like HAD superfamily hydrolase